MTPINQRKEKGKLKEKGLAASDDQSLGRKVIYVYENAQLGILKSASLICHAAFLARYARPTDHTSYPAPLAAYLAHPPACPAHHAA
jgi:hypothetical protein